MSAPSLRVAVVVYLNPVEELERLCRSLVATVGVARRRGSIGPGTLALGDGSPDPVLVPAAVARLEAIVAAEGLDIEVDMFNENLGSAGGNNRLLRNSTEDLALVINPDTSPAPRLLAVLADRLAAEDDIALVEARQVPIEQPKYFDPVTGDTSWSSGCCYLARRALVFGELGGYDHENFPLYCDDVDLSWRIRLAGYRVVHAARAVIFHDKRIRPDGGVAYNDAEVYWGALSALLLYRKYGRPELVESVSAYMARDGSELQRRALEDYRRREVEGCLPDPLPQGDTVAQFVGSDYAEHRFAYV